MSAIAGIYHYGSDRPVDLQELSRMVDVLEHRGQDGAGVWYEGAIGMGHRMLWTTPESLLEKLPATRGPFTITADARIDNREELIEALELRQHPPDKLTDSDLILAAYQRWGAACPERLLGDFAFAIWDASKQELFCARDPLGVKPFYYFTANGLLLFASEIKALFCLPEVPRQINEIRIGDYIEVCLHDKTSTFFQDIYRLAPAHTLQVNREGLRFRTYWLPDPKQDLHLKSSQEYGEAYREVFTQAVKCRLRSAFPVGSALSGGLDSSSIVCVMRELLSCQNQLPFKTFSAIFEEVPASDEREYINAVLNQGGVSPIFVDLSQISPLVDLEKMFWHQDELFCTPNLYIHWTLYQVVQQQGVRVFLDGYLGDNIVQHGWEYREDLARSFRWLQLADSIWQTARRYPDVSPWRLMRQYIWHSGLKPLIPTSLFRFRRRLQGHPQPDWLLRATTNPTFAAQIGLRDRLQSIYNTMVVPGLTPSRQVQFQALISGEIPISLETSNKAAAAFGIESRFPFSDRRLVELCLAIPSSQRIENGLSRMFVRRGLHDLLPEKILQRGSKGDLSHNFDWGLQRFEGDRLEATLLNHYQAIEPYFDLPVLQQSYARYRKNPTGGHIPSIWLAFSLALWLQYVGSMNESLHNS